jgi:DNA-directed RNA polymerase specialized sigma24 family protein
MTLRRKANQARNEFEIKGITKEVCFRDLERRDEETEECVPFDAIDPNSEEPYLAIENDEEISLEPEPTSPRLTPEALQFLTPQQRRATELCIEGVSERDAAQKMGISQPYFHEIMYGKNGQGGVIKRLKKYFAKTPYQMTR